jgi:hypothetical protein
MLIFFISHFLVVAEFGLRFFSHIILSRLESYYFRLCCGRIKAVLNPLSYAEQRKKNEVLRSEIFLNTYAQCCESGLVASGSGSSISSESGSGSGSGFRVLMTKN